MKKQTDKNLFLEQIRKTPIVQAACEKMNISRQTVYRWKKEDAVFSTALEEALKDGRGLVNDVAISQLLSAIKSGNMTAITFWLKHFDENFKTKVEISGTVKQIRESLTEEETEIIAEALKLAGFSEDQITIQDQTINKETNEHREQLPD